MILDRINNAISKIEAWFKETYGKDCVTTRTIDESGGIRLWWAEKIIGLAGFTLEQAPNRTTFGTAENNDSGDISNYSTNISTFVQEFLLEKYRDNSVVAISSISANNVSLANDELSKTIELSIAPTNTTQNHFIWKSSDESVVEVYGGTNKAVLVNKGTGTATITVTNRYKPSVSANFEVTVMGLDYYSITNNLTNVTSNNNSTSIQAKSSYNATLNANNGYSINSVKITMGGNDITSSVYSNGVINIPSVTGNLVITVVATSNIITITNNLTNVTTNNSITSMEKNNPYSANLTVVDGYTLQSVKVVMGGVDVTSSVYSNGVINIETVNGNIVITANAIGIATSTNLGVESGSIDLDGTNLENSKRFRTAFIEVEHEFSSEEVSDYELSMVSIDASTGLEKESTTRCSTSYIPVIAHYDAINVETDVYHSYLVRYYKYENGEYKFLKSEGTTWIDKACALKNMPKETTHLRLAFRGDDTGNSTITNIDISNTVITFIKSVAIDLDLGDNYGYYFRFYDHDFGCDESFKVHNGVNIAWSGKTISQGIGLNGKGTLRFATVNTIKYIRLIGYDSTNYGSDIDISTLQGSITVNGVEYDLTT